MAHTETLLLSGATGLVGSRICANPEPFASRVLGLTRDAKRAHFASGAVEGVAWDGVTPPVASLREADAVLHLAGEPLFAGPLTRARRKRVQASRVDSTYALCREIAALPSSARPRALLCASAVGYYGSRGEDILDEAAAAGSGYLAELCQRWETAAREAEQSGVRVVTLRIGLVLARAGGALPLMAIPFRIALGGRLGSGRQWVPWIHIDDLVSMLAFALAGELRGPVNAVSPQPLRNVELTRALGRALRRPTLLPVPAFALRALLGDLASELLDSRRVIPAAARAAGFQHRVPGIDEALEIELAHRRPGA